MRTSFPFVAAGLVLFLSLAGCNKKATSVKATKASIAIPARPAAQGSLVVVGTLQKVSGQFPANDLYKYAYVMKYSVDTVVEGAFASGEILVAHYDPRTARSAIQDDQKGKVGGTLSTFREGEKHYLVLRPLDSAWTGALEDNYPQEKSPRWFATWAQGI
ncbi:MAG TPA: hypothetical protein PKO15_03420 [Fibrobacteria bacterium]|nr:hypothetical protein [Fibrobacteria bacterium]